MRTPLLRRFASQYGIDLDEAEKPIEAYSGLQEFFTRRLREGARPIAAGEDVVVSPADGTVVEVGTVHQGMLLDAKDAGFTLATCWPTADAAARLEGGPYCVTYLSPRDYHRVHSPVVGARRGLALRPRPAVPGQRPQRRCASRGCSARTSGW